MNVDIENIVNYLIQKTDWIQHIITFLSVFLGAYFAYRFANRQEQQKDKKLRIENYNILWNKIALSLNNLFTYKEVYLDEIKQAFDKDDFEKALRTSYIPSSDFSFDERHYFVNLYNRCFLTELSLLSKIAISMTEEIKCYYQDVFDVLYAKDNEKQIFQKKYEHLKKRFMLLYNEFEHLCARSYYINKEFIKGFTKYFNLYSYEVTLDNFELEAKITERIHNKESIRFIKERETQFDIYWQIDSNIWCNICLWIRKVKHSFKFLINFFKKPKMCKACLCRKIRVRSNTEELNL